MTPRSRLTDLQKLLGRKIRKHRRELWDWHLSHAKKAPPPFYCSVDLRDSGYKIVPVDSNLFPAGFNNICPADIRAAAPIMRAQIEANAAHMGASTAKKILIIPESHTSNRYYIENLYFLKGIIEDAGFEVQIGWYGSMPEGTNGAIDLVSESEKHLTAHPIQIQDGVISAGGMTPDLVLLNNDFSSGYPKILDGLKQPVLPSHKLGWHTRKKSEHFVHYNALAKEFAQIIDVDPWLLQIDTEVVGPVNFNEGIGTTEAAEAAERVLARTKAAYQAHSIQHEPFVFVKNNAGTYGMGIMVVHSANELREMNRRTKNKMSVGKNKLPIDSVVVQEGIPTATLVDRLAAEPVIYVVGCELIGGFLRTNTEKGVEENLNSQGMVFKKLCMSDLQRPGEDEEPEDGSTEEPTLELVYGSIARISALAAGLEIASH